MNQMKDNLIGKINYFFETRKYFEKEIANKRNNLRYREVLEIMITKLYDEDTEETVYRAISALKSENLTLMKKALLDLVELEEYFIFTMKQFEI